MQLHDTSEYLRNILSKTELSKIQAMLEDEDLFNALKKCVLSGVYADGIMKEGEPHDPRQNFILGKISALQMVPDEVMGQAVRSILDAVSMIETSFDEIKKLKIVQPEVPEKKNRGK